LTRLAADIAGVNKHGYHMTAVLHAIFQMVFYLTPTPEARIISIVIIGWGGFLQAPAHTLPDFEHCPGRETR
jgi:hypothetical protein